MQHVHKYGNWHEARFITKKRNIDGEVTHILYVTRVVSKEKRRELEKEHLRTAYETAEQANEAKTEFLFNMSHDIRTPMNAIMGYSHLIKRDFEQPEKILHYQQKMEQASTFLLSLLNNVLDMARIESGKIEVDNNCMNVVKGIDDILEVFEDEAREKNLAFEYAINVQTQHVMNDVVKVKQIYSNLLSNAIKYTPSGGKVRVIVEEFPGDKEGFVNIRTVFEDTEIGMSKEFLPHLFDEFSRERNF